MYSPFFTGFFNNTELKIFGHHGIEPRTVYITHKHSAIELQPPAGKQTLQFCTLGVLLCYSLTLNRPTKISFLRIVYKTSE